MKDFSTALDNLNSLVGESYTEDLRAALNQAQAHSSHRSWMRVGYKLAVLANTLEERSPEVARAVDMLRIATVAL